jgi:VIT1/CCC1 family predicted Fe2+/Mn2+ transporter
MGKITSKMQTANFLRNFVFGVEDSLVSTVGLLSGVAIADVPRATIFLTGLILIFVEAFSMGVGSFLSEQSSEGYIKQAEPSWGQTAAGAVIMFVSYFISGFIPLFPYVLFETKTAFPISIVLSLLALFLLGMYGAKLSKLNLLRHGLKMMLIGGIAIGLGVFVGAVINTSALL